MSCPLSSSGSHTARKSPIEGWEVVGSSGSVARRCRSASKSAQLELALGVPAPADVQADLVDPLRAWRAPRQVVRAVGRDRDGSRIRRGTLRQHLRPARPTRTSPYDVATADELAVGEQLGDRRPVEIAESSWRIRGSGRTSTAANGVSSACRAATVRAEKPHAGASGVPFMNRITLCSAIASRIASAIGLLPRGCGSVLGEGLAVEHRKVLG